MSARAPSFPPSLYFTSASGDFLFLGGLCLLLFALGELSFPGIHPRLLSLCLVLGVWPHFSATLHQLYFEPDLRRHFPFQVFVAPLLLLVVVSSVALGGAKLASYFI